MHNKPDPQTSQRALRHPGDDAVSTHDGGMSPFIGRHNARYFRADVPYHVISRVFQGRHLLRPGKRLNTIIAGVIGRAQTKVFPHIKLYAMVFMNNHLHIMLQGRPSDISGFVGYVKREISMRWGKEPDVQWPGSMWDGDFLVTALPTHESQVRCLRYILGHGVKEGLVAKPQHWPGIHSARQLLNKTRLMGAWLNGTLYGRALDAQSRAQKPKPIRKADYYETYEVTLETIPAWQHFSPEEQHRQLQQVVDDIIEQGRVNRNGKKPFGAKRVMSMALAHRTKLPRPPWFEARKALICWSDSRVSETRQYVSEYWDFQWRFREAAQALKRGVFGVVFPPGAFRPGVMQPLAA